jgi:hypothetical protein
MYSSYSFSTSALDGVSGQRHTPAALYPRGKGPPGTHCREGCVGPRAGLDTEARGKILCLYRRSNLDRPVVQPVGRHYTAWATRLTLYQRVIFMCSSYHTCLILFTSWVRLVLQGHRSLVFRSHSRIMPIIRLFLSVTDWDFWPVPIQNYFFEIMNHFHIW